MDARQVKGAGRGPGWECGGRAGDGLDRGTGMGAKVANS